MLHSLWFCSIHPWISILSFCDSLVEVGFPAAFTHQPCSLCYSQIQRFVDFVFMERIAAVSVPPFNGDEFPSHESVRFLRICEKRKHYPRKKKCRLDELSLAVLMSHSICSQVDEK
ncbi:hypothetical protein VNO77_31774 [Canavalia gladiata]|uniref:Uncharacterized protein n=1 Tax=Canavalia gladiata TaxID=3824 RepID=A0AAN9KP83_CANGL